MAILSTQASDIIIGILLLIIGLPLMFVGHKIYKVWFFGIGFIISFITVSAIYDSIFHLEIETNRTHVGKFNGSILGGIIGGSIAVYCSKIELLIMSIGSGFELGICINHVFYLSDIAIQIINLLSLSIIFVILSFKFKHIMLMFSTSSVGSAFCIKATDFFLNSKPFDIFHPFKSYELLFLNETPMKFVMKFILTLIGMVTQAFLSDKVDMMSWYLWGSKLIRKTNNKYSEVNSQV